MSVELLLMNFGFSGIDEFGQLGNLVDGLSLPWYPVGSIVLSIDFSSEVDRIHQILEFCTLN